ncbi:unnamed protein product [Paramecium primaurelia]|uniref:Uncharacterized protein n=1 Tax=Paramecium primaurelia TaxID=5886 RepID=A0A8S1LAK6_PARPR|nr:unnamed protein product [Paramecium primaurelia]
MKTGHWSLQEHTTQIIFLQQFEGKMTSSMMKKTSKIFKQLRELIVPKSFRNINNHYDQEQLIMMQENSISMGFIHRLYNMNNGINIMT